ncbi:hypothetical protein [Pseudoxanthomonas japonensis]|uniref:Uncharacterized protein n=1 Tax=Pseudoxanthomonas japonensis TaxID=69284 RepID=A0ABQ6ZL68_9GAMM|nr:hypothetical protein [Pseudoxanthomonas japonensis]KAF1726992.1 hypothetical protein CSC78_02515 [Pseudoxanthomonas japonensis]
MLSKERFAWVWLTALVVVFALYFTYVSVNADAVAAMHMGQRIGLLAIALGSLGVIALLTAVFGRHREEDGTPTLIDERDRRIDSRASVYAYYVLMAGIIVVGCVMPFTTGGWTIVHATLLAIAAAELVHAGLVIHGYRRGLRV